MILIKIEWIILLTLYFIVVHELMHIYTARALGVKAKVYFKWWCIYVYLQGFSGKKYRELTREERKRYAIIATTPYLIFIPFFAFLLVIAGDPFMFYYSVAMLFVNLVNLPLEWAVK